MIKYFLIVLAIVSFNFVLGQNTKRFDCLLLQKTIETEIFQKHFFIRKDSGNVLTIVDTAKYFDDCILPEICKRKIQISRVYPKRINPNRSNNNKDDFFKIILYKAEIKESNYFLYFWQPRNNGNMILELKSKKGKIKVKLISLGVF